MASKTSSPERAPRDAGSSSSPASEESKGPAELRGDIQLFLSAIFDDQGHKLRSSVASNILNSLDEDTQSILLAAMKNHNPGLTLAYIESHGFGASIPQRERHMEDILARRIRSTFIANQADSIVGK